MKNEDFFNKNLDNSIINTQTCINEYIALMHFRLQCVQHLLESKLADTMEADRKGFVSGRSALFGVLVLFVPSDVGVVLLGFDAFVEEAAAAAAATATAVATFVVDSKVLILGRWPGKWLIM